MLSLLALSTMVRWFSGARKSSCEEISSKEPADSGFLLKGGLLLLMLLISQCTYSQQKILIYDIIRKNETLGTVEASRITKGAQTKYHVESHVAIRLFADIKVDVWLNSNYINGIMTEAWMRKTINGRDKTNNHLLKKNDGYCFINIYGDTSSLQSSITRSISTLYFTEPLNLEKIFSENFLRYVPLQNKGQGTYKILLPDGHVNSYTYKNSICTEVEMETPLSNVFLKLKSVTDNL